MIKKINYKEFYEEFLKTSVGQQVLNDFDEITCTNNHRPSIIMLSQGHKSTCRELLGNPNIKSTNNNTTISIVTFYYLQFLQEKNPKNIYDIGCGWNIWSKYIPNIIGIDNISHYAHVLEDYNLDYINKNYKKIESAFSINMSSSMPKHSVVDKDIPITFANLAEYIEQFSSIIKPGGRGYVALSAIVPLITTSTKWFEDNNLTRYAIPELTNYVEQVILLQKNIKVIALDIELDILNCFPSHDGEIRVVFEVLS